LLRSDNIKYVVIPRASVIEGGDYVKLTKLEEEKNG